MSLVFSVREISDWTGGQWVNRQEIGAEQGDLIRVRRPAPLQISRADDLAFFFSKSYQNELPHAAPGILITGEAFVAPLKSSGLALWKKSAVIACADPYLAMAVLSEKFARENSSAAHIKTNVTTKVSASAEIHPSAQIGKNVFIGPNCVVAENAIIGDGCFLYSGISIGERVKLGSEVILFPNVTIYEWTEIGNRVRVHAGSVVGSDGFGYAPKMDSGRVNGHQKIYHLGRVVIGDDVEIGANCTVARGTIDDTKIDCQVKLDNLVHIGHNAWVEEGAILCGGTCLAGNAHIGKFAYVGGLVGVTNHVHVGDGAKVAALSLVSKDVPAGGTALGNPQRDHREHFRAHALLSKLLKDKENGGK